MQSLWVGVGVPGFRLRGSRFSAEGSGFRSRKALILEQLVVNTVSDIRLSLLHRQDYSVVALA